MLYLIQEALKTAKQKELEAEQINQNWGTIPPGGPKLSDYSNLDGASYPTIEYSKGYTTTIVAPNFVGGNIFGNGTSDNPYTLTASHHTKAGDRYFMYQSYIQSRLQEYVEELDEDAAEELNENYGYAYEDDDNFREWLTEVDVLLSNDTFASDYDLKDLIDDYFDSYI